MRYESHLLLALHLSLYKTSVCKMSMNETNDIPAKAQLSKSTVWRSKYVSKCFMDGQCVNPPFLQRVCLTIYVTFWKRQTDSHPYFMQQWAGMMKASLNFTLKLSFFWLYKLNVSHHGWTTYKRHWILGDRRGRLWDADERRLWQKAFSAVVVGWCVAQLSLFWANWGLKNGNTWELH